VFHLTILSLLGIVSAVWLDDSQAGEMGQLELVHVESRTFRIPFALPVPDRAKVVKEVRLYVSRDRGKTWTFVEPAATPDGRAFVFTAPEDGLYWFGLRSVTLDGTIVPRQLTPSLKVLIREKQTK
jgi:hypothetical protein